MTNNCQICHQPLDQFEVEHNHKYHQDCKNCIYCNSAVHVDIIAKLVKEEDKQTDVKILIYHQPCRDEKLKQEFKLKPVTITQAHLDMLNRSHLFMNQVMHSSSDLSIETNQEICERQVQPWFSELDLEDKFRALKNLEAITAMMSIALSKDKNSIKSRIEAKEIQKYKEAQEYREQQKEKKETRQVSAGQKIQRENERANPELKADRKAIEQFMKLFKMSETEAIAMLNKSKGVVN